MGACTSCEEAVIHDQNTEVDPHKQRMIKEYLMQVTNSPGRQAQNNINNNNNHHHHQNTQPNSQNHFFKQTNATQNLISSQFAEQTLYRKSQNKEKTDPMPSAPEKRVSNKEKTDPHSQQPQENIKPQMKASLVEQSASKKSMKNLHQASGQKSERNLKQPSSNQKPQQTAGKSAMNNVNTNMFPEGSTNHKNSSSNLKNSSLHHSTFGRPFESSAKKSLKQSQEFEKQSFYQGAKANSAFESASDLHVMNQGNPLGESSRMVSDSKINPHIPYGRKIYNF